MTEIECDVRLKSRSLKVPPLFFFKIHLRVQLHEDEGKTEWGDVLQKV